MKYVDYENKICILGYGTVVVHSTLGRLIIYEIESEYSIEPGSTFNSKEVSELKQTGNKIFVDFSKPSEITKMKKLLNEVEENEGGIFKFNDITFDFSKYHEGSIKTFREILDILYRNLVFISAC